MEENHVSHSLDTQQNVLMSLYGKTQKSCLCVFVFYLLILTHLIFSNDITIFNICVSFSTPKYVSLPVQANTSWHILLFLKQILNSKGHFPQQNVLPASHNKAEKICHIMEAKIKRRGGKRKSCKLAKGSSTDQLPNHNSKTMSNKKLSKSNFHCHPRFSRSHLPLLWHI